jgi:hypothetical protein
MVSLAKLLIIRQGIEKKYKNMGLEKFQLSISFWHYPNENSQKREITVLLCL